MLAIEAYLTAWQGMNPARKHAIQQQLMLLIHAYKCKLPAAENSQVADLALLLTWAVS